MWLTVPYNSCQACPVFGLHILIIFVSPDQYVAYWVSPDQYVAYWVSPDQYVAYWVSPDQYVA